MQLKDGTRNLHDVTRYYAGESIRASAGASLYRDQDVDMAINLALQEVWGEAKRQDMGWSVNIGHRDSTAGTVWYDAPSTMDGNLVMVELEPNGKDISSDSTASPIELIQGSFRTEWVDYSQGNLTEHKYVLFKTTSDGQNQYGIIAPPTTGGTNAIRLTFEQEINSLSNDGDEPIHIPETHHELICILAAIRLRRGKDLSTRDLEGDGARLYPGFVEDVGPRFNVDPDFQPKCAGLGEFDFFTKHGFRR